MHGCCIVTTPLHACVHQWVDVSSSQVSLRGPLCRSWRFSLQQIDAPQMSSRLLACMQSRCMVTNSLKSTTELSHQQRQWLASDSKYTDFRTFEWDFGTNASEQQGSVCNPVCNLLVCVPPFRLVSQAPGTRQAKAT